LLAAEGQLRAVAFAVCDDGSRVLWDLIGGSASEQLNDPADRATDSA
jgi:hypothetical protein